MGEIARWGARSLYELQSSYRSAPSPRSPALSRLARVAGLFVAAAAALIGAVLTVLFAATLAVVMVLATALLGLAALAWRVGRPAQRNVVLEARKLGHSWVAYGWDQRPR